MRIKKGVVLLFLWSLLTLPVFVHEVVHIFQTQPETWEICLSNGGTTAFMRDVDNDLYLTEQQHKEYEFQAYTASIIVMIGVLGYGWLNSKLIFKEEK